MSGGEARVQRIYRDLSARERAQLVSRAANARERPDYLVYFSMPDDQVAEFNALMALCRGVALPLGAYVLTLRAEVDRLPWLQLVLALGTLFVEYGHAMGAPAAQSARRGNPVAKSPADLERALRALAERLAAELTAAGERLAAVEVVAEGAQTALGADPLHPTLRHALAHIRAELEAVREEAAPFVGELPRPDADPATVAGLRDLIAGSAPSG